MDLELDTFVAPSSFHIKGVIIWSTTALIVPMIVTCSSRKTVMPKSLTSDVELHQRPVLQERLVPVVGLLAAGVLVGGHGHHASVIEGGLDLLAPK